jgi:hypothetical protein
MHDQASKVIKEVHVENYDLALFINLTGAFKRARKPLTFRDLMRRYAAWHNFLES